MSKQTEAMKLALEALLSWGKGFPDNWGDLDTEAVTALREAMAEQPAQQEPEKQIAEALRRRGLTLVKTAKGYDVMNLGQITAHGIKGDA